MGIGSHKFSRFGSLRRSRPAIASAPPRLRWVNDCRKRERKSRASATGRLILFAGRPKRLGIATDSRSLCTSSAFDTGLALFTFRSRSRFPNG